MNLQKIATALAAPNQVTEVQAIRAEVAKGSPKDVVAQLTLVQRLQTLAATLNSGTITRQRSIANMNGPPTIISETVPAWNDIGLREVDFGDVLVALGLRWEDLSIKVTA